MYSLKEEYWDSLPRPPSMTPVAVQNQNNGTSNEKEEKGKKKKGWAAYESSKEQEFEEGTMSLTISSRARDTNRQTLI